MLVRAGSIVVYVSRGSVDVMYCDDTSVVVRSGSVLVTCGRVEVMKMVDPSRTDVYVIYCDDTSVETSVVVP